MAGDPGSSWGVVEVGAIVGGLIMSALTAMATRIVHLQDRKIEQFEDRVGKSLALVESKVLACEDRDKDHAAALAAHQLHTERTHPSKSEMEKALDAQYSRLAELILLHNDNVSKRFDNLAEQVGQILDRERNHRSTDR